MGGGFGWQLDGLLISQSNQKMSMKEAGKIKSVFREWICCLFSESSKIHSKAERFSRNSLQHVFSMVMISAISRAIGEKRE